MRPAKRRRGRSAMRILINDKAVDELTPKVAKSLMLSKVQSEVKARVRTPAEATEFYVSQTKRWFLILGGIAVVLMAAISIAGLSYEPNDAPFLIVGMLVIIGALLLFMVLLLRHRVRTWNARLKHRGEGLPPAGTAIFLDDKALSVGSDIFAWPALVIDQVELSESSVQSGDTSTLVHVIERLSVKAGPKSVTLDRALIENGLLLVDNAWRKLQAPLSS
jgi:hypothetical protein